MSKTYDNEMPIYTIGQIVLITLDDYTNNEVGSIPAIITNIVPHEDKERAWPFTYSFTIPVKGQCEFVSYITQENRALWRFIKSTAVPDAVFNSMKNILEQELIANTKNKHCWSLSSDDIHQVHRSDENGNKEFMFNKIN